MSKVRAILDSFRRKSVSPSLIADMRFEDLAPVDFVRLAYLVLLKRPIDPTGLAAWNDVVSRGMFSYEYVVSAILKSDEYAAHDTTVANDRLHAARQRWVRTLPAFGRLLDIGGSSPNRAEGALIQLGYPHRPSTLDILDLPPEQQNWGTPKYDQSVPTQFDWGTVTYFHGGAETVADVAPLQDKIYDAIFMGQAIEHVRPEALPSLLDWIRRHLAADGRFIMDTPNRLLTKIQCPTWFIHPDHKLEYEPAQLERIFAEHGFAVVNRTGLVHLPRVAQSGKFDMREFNDAELLHDNVDECYLFAFEAAPSSPTYENTSVS